MKNKNNVVLSIIAIATILVTVIGATFAYFASTVDNGTGSNFTAVVEDNDVLFTATGSNMTMEVTADKMTQHASSGGVIEAAKAQAEAMNVSLTVGTSKPIMCKYNIYFQWDSTNAAYLTKTSGATKEFTAQLSLSGGGTQGQNKLVSETQLTDVVTNANKTLVVEGAAITASASQSGSQTWSPTIRFYNLQLNQTNLAGKTFKGKFTIDDVECGGVSTLSETIIAKVNDNDYTSSQDSSIYKVARETASSLNPNAEYVKLIQSEYGSVIEYKGDNPGTITSDGTSTTGMYIYNEADNTWSNNSENMESDSNYHLVLSVPEEGYYQLCYKVNVAAASNRLYVQIPDSNNTTSGEYGTDEGLSSLTSTYTCKGLTYLTPNNAVRVIISTSTSKASVTFYLQRTNQSVSADAGIRYEGLDPDNYITFNGETAGWRIIGVFEGSTIGLEPGKQYTKIIRNTRIGSYEWDKGQVSEKLDGVYDEGEPENDWENSTLNTYLNETYFGDLSDVSKIAKYYENYSTWYLRGMHNSKLTNGAYIYTPDAYIYERISGMPGYRNGVEYAASTETKAAIGLMYLSDYGYAAYGSACNNKTTSSLYNYGYNNYGNSQLSGCAAVDWLATDSIINKDLEWVISPTSYDTFLIMGIYGGIVNSNRVNAAHAVRPTLYLEANLTATGTGTKLDPYVLN